MHYQRSERERNFRKRRSELLYQRSERETNSAEREKRTGLAPKQWGITWLSSAEDWEKRCFVSNNGEDSILNRTNYSFLEVRNLLSVKGLYIHLAENNSGFGYSESISLLAQPFLKRVVMVLSLMFEHTKKYIMGSYNVKYQYSYFWSIS